MDEGRPIDGTTRHDECHNRKEEVMKTKSGLLAGAPLLIDLNG